MTKETTPLWVWLSVALLAIGALTYATAVYFIEYIIGFFLAACGLRARFAAVRRPRLPQQLGAGKSERDHDGRRGQQGRDLAGMLDAETIGDRADASGP